MGDKTRGLYGKYEVHRTDGKDAPGGKHENCDLFILDISHDPHAVPAIAAYSQSCRPDGYGLLADDLDKKVQFAGRMLKPSDIDAMVKTEKIDHSSYSCWRTWVGDTVISTDQSEMTAVSFANGVRRGLRKALGFPS